MSGRTLAEVVAEQSPTSLEIAEAITHEAEMRIASAGAAVLILESKGHSVDRGSLEPSVQQWLAAAADKMA